MNGFEKIYTKGIYIRSTEGRWYVNYFMEEDELDKETSEELERDLQRDLTIGNID